MQQAISEIKKISELTNENMNLIIDMLNDVLLAVETNDEVAQNERKIEVKGYLKCLSETGLKVIEVLAGLATITGFFGF